MFAALSEEKRRHNAQKHKSSCLVFKAAPPGSAQAKEVAIAPKDQSASLGQQLIDLQKAKTAGALTDSEYEEQKAKLLGNK